MKTERIEFMAAPDLKAQMQEEAGNLNISLGELIRRRFAFDEEEKELEIITASLKKSTAEAQGDLAFAAKEVTKLLKDLRLQRLRNEST